MMAIKSRIFISSLHLLNIVPMSSHSFPDVTYKSGWLGFSVSIGDTTDLSKAFHPVGLATCLKEIV